MDAPDSFGPLGISGRTTSGHANKDIVANRTNEAIRVGLAVYRVTQKFPPDEPLREKLRQLVIDSIAASAHMNQQNALQAFSQLVALLHLASPLGFAASENFSVLISAYRSLSNQFVELQSQQLARPGGAKPRRISEEGMIRRRQAKILAILKHGGPHRLRDFSSALVGVSARTIRRDLNELCQQGLIVRQGFGASSSYFLLATKAA